MIANHCNSEEFVFIKMQLDHEKQYYKNDNDKKVTAAFFHK